MQGMSGSHLDFAREVLDTPVSDEMRDSFLAYSLSVITSRALPDVRDGLKPVQRRILYGLAENGMRPSSPHKKSARVVGDVMGKYHPHGDSAIYDALVRMAQDFSMRIPLVDGHGNFGSHEDPPAAMRYTECRMAPAALDMVGELDEDTVEWRDNFDGEEQEPAYLPARLPNLIVNGSSGIAVGMATNMAPHNLRETVSALKLILDNPETSVHAIMRRLKGPDFPTGGAFIKTPDLIEIYTTGRGSIRVRAKATTGQVSGRRQGITVTELPYGVGPERVITRINALVESGKLPGIAAVTDLSDRKHGLQIVIECKTGVNANALLGELYRQTPLEDSFAVNNVVLVDGRPTTIGIRDLMRHYIDHRLDVVTRRTEFRLRRAREREHIVEGLVIAVDNIDEVVRIIRGSKDTPQARERLIERFSFSEIQANHVLEMPLRRLTALEVDKLRDELAELRRLIADLLDILERPERRREIVGDELDEVARLHGDARRTAILEGDDAVIEATSLEIADEACVVELSSTNYLGRRTDEAWTKSPSRNDLVTAKAGTTTRGPVWALSSSGVVYPIEAVEIPEIQGRSRGGKVTEIFDLARGERIVGVVGIFDLGLRIDENSELTDTGERLLTVVTRSGVIKRLTAGELADSKVGADFIALKDGDRVVAAFAAPADAEVAIVSSDAQLLRTATDQVRPQGRSAGGMAGMKLKDKATVIAAGRIDPTDVVVTVTDRGGIKLTEAGEFPAKGRATGGVRITRFKKDEQQLTHAKIGPRVGLAAATVGSDLLDSGSDVSAVNEGASKRDAPSTRTDRAFEALGWLRQ